MLIVGNFVFLLFYVTISMVGECSNLFYSLLLKNNMLS